MKTLNQPNGAALNVDQDEVAALEQDLSGNTRIHLKGGQTITAAGPVEDTSKELEIPFETFDERNERKKRELHEGKDNG